MNILEKMEQKRMEFEETNNLIRQKENEINQLVQARTEIQGAYKILMELGIESGILDMDGNVIQEREEILEE